MLYKPQPKGEVFDMNWIEKEVKCWVYYPNEQEGPIYRKGVVKGIRLMGDRRNSMIMGVLDNNMQFQTKAYNLEKYGEPSHLEKDLINLHIINAAEVLNQLKRKLEEQKIHTYLWNSLIIVNPFKVIPHLYQAGTKQHYYEQIFKQKKALTDTEPHVYAYIANILNKLKHTEKTQVLSISGESGSGKTQTNKQCLKIISFVCEREAQHREINSIQIEELVLKCDGILESFGNAKTSKNDNSSRFGKLIVEKIDPYKMEIMGCQIKVFFLQKSRIIVQSLGERNFHIFYQLLKFCPHALRSELKLLKNGYELKASDFKFLRNSVNVEMTTSSDEEMWRDLNSSFEELRFDGGQVLEIYKIIAGVLYLGNLQFDDDDFNEQNESPCDIDNMDVFQNVCHLLGYSEHDLKSILLYNKIVVPNVDTYQSPVSKARCIDNTHAIAKSIYQNLFLFIVNELNAKINQNTKSDKNCRVIKMLDIYGFEVFHHNSFQQLCVNYTNQRIHQIYLDQVFKHEKNTLKNEGLQAVISKLNFTDNTKIIELLDSAVKSIFGLLNDVCLANANDNDFLDKVHNQWVNNHENFPPSNYTTTKKAFIIKHTPCEIEYQVKGFIGKNRDSIKPEVLQVLQKTKIPFLRKRFQEQAPLLKSDSKARKFLGEKVRKQVSSLINQMSLNTELHFIRCIKPNQQKRPFTFVQRICYNQIKYLGILDTVQMRKDCYHVRLPYDKFYQRYGILEGKVSQMLKVQSREFSNEECKTFTKNLFQNQLKNQKLDYLFGRDRIFMKMQTQLLLDKVFKEKIIKIDYASTVIKALHRYQKEREDRNNFQVHVGKVQRAVRSYLRDIVIIKKKKAVKIIENAWIKFNEEYFLKKKRQPLMAIQKYLKAVIAKSKTRNKEQKAKFLKHKLKSVANTNKTYSKFSDYQMIKKEVKGDLYDSIWRGIQRYENGKIEKYIKGFKTKKSNRERILFAESKTASRLNLKFRKSLEQYLHGFLPSRHMSILQKSVCRIQSIFRMRKIRNWYLDFRKKIRLIQNQWRRYKRNKQASLKFTRDYFKKQPLQAECKNTFYRNLYRNFNYSQDGIERILTEFEKVKKDKIVLFYYLLDIQMLTHDPILQDWHRNYKKLYQETMLKNNNPIQYIDVSNNKTVVCTTNKLYSWGYESNRIEEHNVGNKISKVIVNDENIKVSFRNSSGWQMIGEQKESLSEENGEWSTLKENYVIMNGTVVTVETAIIRKISIPEQVTQLSCGMTHVVCKTVLRKVYSWGNNRMGQLGQGHFYQTSKPKLIDFFLKRKISIVQAGCTAYGTVVLDYNGKVYWFGSNGTIKQKCSPEQCLLNQKSQILGNFHKYTVVRLIPKWSKTMSIFGVTIAIHENNLKNQVTFRKKTLENLMNKWNEDIGTVNPPHLPSVSGYFMQRHMPLPSQSEHRSKNPQEEMKQKILTQLGMIEEIQRDLLRAKRKI